MGFKPAWWLPGAHLQTVWQTLLRRGPRPATVRERLDTPDGDFVDLDWHGPAAGPAVILLHGLTGSSASPCIRGMQAALAGRGWRTVTMNFRGCGGEPNRTALAYHSGDTMDLDHLYRTIRQRHPGCPLAAVGFSLGGNVLLKWLGERGRASELVAAAAVSVPLQLELCADCLDSGFSRVYRNWLLRDLKLYMTRKRRHLEALGRDTEARKLAELGELSGIRSFWEYDDRVVARLYGFRDALDYYRQSSSRRFLRNIRTRTLILQAENDPFLSPLMLPKPAELASLVQLEVTRGGGHVGFIGGTLPWRPDYWLERRIPDFLEDALGGSFSPAA